MRESFEFVFSLVRLPGPLIFNLVPEAQKRHVWKCGKDSKLIGLGGELLLNSKITY